MKLWLNWMINHTTASLKTDHFGEVGFQKSLFPLLAILMLISLPDLVYAQQSGEDRTPIQEITNRFEQGKLFTAAFEHTLVDAFTQDSTTQAGTIWVAKDAYKVKTENQILVVDGKISKAFDRFKNRVIVSKYDAQDDDFAPSKILSGLDSTYTVNRNEVDGDYRIVQLGTEDPFATFSFVEVVTTLDYQPVSITAIDQTDNEYLTQFRKGRFIPSDDSVFTLEVSPEVETVDLRKQ